MLLQNLIGLGGTWRYIRKGLRIGGHHHHRQIVPACDGNGWNVFWHRKTKRRYRLFGSAARAFML
jgi:hypothetical protein